MIVQDPHNLSLNLSRLLLKKGIGFCLYRFPAEENLYLAVGKDFLDWVEGNATNKKSGFIISPFIENTASSKVLFGKISTDQGMDSLFKLLAAEPDREVRWGDLPEAISKNEYLEKCKKYLAVIRGGQISKAILSRVIRRDKPDSLDIFSFYIALARAYPETFASLFYIPGMGIWTGASPELLLLYNWREYATMALAASQPKINNPEYTWRKKEQHEHSMVREHIEQVFLHNDCSIENTSGTYTIETGLVAHLRTDYLFKEAEGENHLAGIIAELHPTPAIGGLPVKASLDCIERYEGYNRNYYTGYLGEINGQDTARLFVNLRCMQIGKSQMAIFVGGGISADSDPEEEWAETNQKSLTLLQILEETTRSHAQ